MAGIVAKFDEPVYWSFDYGEWVGPAKEAQVPVGCSVVECRANPADAIGSKMCVLAASQASTEEER